MAAAVEVVESELVPPSDPTPRGALWLSNLDLAWNGYTPTVYFFRRPDDDGQHPRPGFFSADVLRAALAAALVPFYPFAGRLAAGRDGGRAEIDCNAEGALFVVARSAAALDDFEGFAPSKAMRDMFVPAYEPAGAGTPLLLLQVTFFRCGGVALGTAMHHFVIDGRSAFNFIRTWAAIARGDAGAAVVPSLDRTPLRARPQPTVLFDHTHEYGGGNRRTTAAASGGGTKAAEYASAILRVTAAEAAALRASAGGVSTFRALVAHVWRCACAARALDPDDESRLYTMVDMRARLSPPLPAAFFGNAVARTSTSARVGDLLGNSLGFGARRLLEATGHGDEYARSVVDYLETPDPAAMPRGGLPDTDLRVVSWLGMPSYDADFGWGEPALLAPALMYYTGYVYLLNCPGKEGGVAVAVALEPERMERFKELFFEELATLV